MASEILRPEGKQAAPTSSTEVEFALVLSRMIESIRNDPEHLRSTIYELARHKLKEQFGSDETVDIHQLSKSLEVAIQGVETFEKKNPPALPGPGTAPGQRMLAAPRGAADVRASVVDVSEERKTSRFTAPWRFVVLIAIVLAIVFAVKQRAVTVDSLQQQAGRLVALRTRPASVQEAPQDKPNAGSREAVQHEPAQPPPLTPTSYGIYAVSDDKLYELELLPGRAPDIRVAISPVIPTPSKTTLPDGHLKFIVYRRDSATSAADRAEIRVIAKVAQEMNFDKSGKPVTSKVDDAWVIRNIAIPFRTSPKRDNPDMYEVQSENPDSVLQPGRYALVLKGQAYDFSVAGTILDPRQCLERMAATNGQFYSQCQKP